MANAIIDTFDLWTTAQNLKTSNRGLSASNQSLLGIKKLRELILELAVSGKLVPQDPKDEPANVLLGNIEKEKKHLVKEGVIKKQDAIPEIEEAEKPFKLPVGWQWIRIKNAGHDWGQKTPDSDFTYIDVSAIDNTKGEVKAPTILKASETPSRARKIVRPGTVIYSTVRPYLKNICVIDKQYSPEPIASTAFAIMHPYLQMPGRFFLFYLQSPVFIRYVESVQNGIAYPAINDKQFFGGLLPLPPLAEQHRIVSKVDELMALCDQLELQQTSNNEAHQTLVDALLGTLTNAENPAAFEEAWQRISNHFDTLLTTEHSIDQLKQTILQLAVMGKLVPQNPDDEPASELLKKIAKEKAMLVKDGKIRKQAVLSEINTDELPFKLPKEWVWVKMEDICTLITDGTHLTPRYSENGRVFISAQNIKPFQFIPDNHKWVSEEHYQGYIKNRKPERGDILLTRVGAGIGEAAVIDIDLEFAIYVSVGLLKINKENLNPNYLVLWLNSPLGRLHSARNTYGKGVSQGNLNLSRIRNFAVSLPPLAEQQLIFAKVNELFALCDTLKERLSDAQALQNQLAVAVVEQAV